jgi:hypothetical protein
MKAAAEAGLAPHVWYTNIEDRIFTNNAEETVYLQEYFGEPPD